uniref:Uncharacterized protein n=1 Tax=Solanum lycopersicum TaxID=4081 RepID=K4DE49_SOLLC
MRDIDNLRFHARSVKPPAFSNMKVPFEGGRRTMILSLLSCPAFVSGLMVVHTGRMDGVGISLLRLGLIKLCNLYSPTFLDTLEVDPCHKECHRLSAVL